METKHIYSLGGGRYESPETSVIDIVSEGVLCGSTPAGAHETWGNGSPIEWDE